MMEPYGVYDPSLAYDPSLYDPSMYMTGAVANFCELCSQAYKEVAFAPCGHACCNGCVGKLRAGPDKLPKCPFCSTPVSKFMPLAYVPAYPPMYGMPPMPGTSPTGY